MEEKMKFRYFYGEEADQYSFYRIPKLLFQSEYFKTLSVEAKITYGLMLDRMSLSLKNNWYDDENRAYIYFSIEDIMELLSCGKNKAIKILQELDVEGGIGLIEKRRQGFGKANIIYVKTFMPGMVEEIVDVEKFEKQTCDEKTADTEVYKTNFKKFKNQTSRSPEIKLQEVYFSNPNNTNINNTKENDTESNLILSGDEMGCDEMATVHAYREIISENIGVQDLIMVHPHEVELIQGILDLIVETLMSQNEKILISSNLYPAQLVKSKLMKLEYSHVEYVLECFSKNTTKVKNVKKYLLAALFNAPATIGGYYRAEVQHDMPQFAV